MTATIMEEHEGLRKKAPGLMNHSKEVRLHNYPCKKAQDKGKLAKHVRKELHDPDDMEEEAEQAVATAVTEMDEEQRVALKEAKTPEKVVECPLGSCTALLASERVELMTLLPCHPQASFMEEKVSSERQN